MISVIIIILKILCLVSDWVQSIHTVLRPLQNTHRARSTKHILHNSDLNTVQSPSQSIVLQVPCLMCTYPAALVRY